MLSNAKNKIQQCFTQNKNHSKTFIDNFCLTNSYYFFLLVFIHTFQDLRIQMKLIWTW